MKKRIYASFIVLALPVIVIMSLLLCLLFYRTLRQHELAALKDNAGLLAAFMDMNATGHMQDYIDYNADTVRMTVITPDGDVLLDNKTVADTLDNHADRPEVAEALRIGVGEAVRYSDTLKTETFYYAHRLKNGNILRMSKPISRMADVFVASLPVVLSLTVIMLFLANWVARWLTNVIIRPLNRVELSRGELNQGELNQSELNQGELSQCDDPKGSEMAPYDELLPYVKKINRQRDEITAQFAALKDRADTIEAITGSMKEGVILIDRNGTVLTANKSAQRIFNNGDMTNQNILHICREINLQHGITACLSGENTEIRFAHNERIYDVYFNCVHHQGAINGGVILYFDCTERFAAEKQRREFSANVSHELQTPLTTIYALAEMLVNGMAKDGDVAVFAEKIGHQAKRLMNIIKDIIRLSEFDEHKVSKELRAVDLYALAASVITDLRTKAEEKNVVITLRATGESHAHASAPDEPVVDGSSRMPANGYMLDELLFNLIDNAIKYNKPNGRVTVTLAEENGFYIITVADTGIGIPPTHQGRVFERFYRVDKSRSKKTGGTGLGLSIVKHIAQFHGGKVTLESTEHIGTTITCYLKAR